MLNEPFLRLLRPDQIAALVYLQFRIPAKYHALLNQDFQRFQPQTIAQVMQTYLTIETPGVTDSAVLVAVGQHETIYARQAARKLQRSIAGARGVLVPQAGHVWNLQQPELFSATVRAWINDRPLPQGLQPLN